MAIDCPRQQPTRRTSGIPHRPVVQQHELGADRNPRSSLADGSLDGTRRRGLGRSTDEQHEISLTYTRIGPVVELGRCRVHDDIQARLPGTEPRRQPVELHVRELAQRAFRLLERHESSRVAEPFDRNLQTPGEGRRLGVLAQRHDRDRDDGTGRAALPQRSHKPADDCVVSRRRFPGSRDELGKRRRRELQHLAVPQRGHGRRSRLVGQHGELTDDLAAAQLGDDRLGTVLVGHRHAHASDRDEVHRVAGVALLHQHRTAGYGPRRGGARTRRHGPPRRAR